MKNIIERNLPLNVKYHLIDKKYIPLAEGCGLACDNCNKLIANIATVKNENGHIFNIGFDCLETILINNLLLSNSDINEIEKVKKMIPQIIRFSKVVKETIRLNNGLITGLQFEVQKYESNYYTFYWLMNHQETGRNNDNVKFKSMDFIFMIETIKNIFPKLTIITH